MNGLLGESNAAIHKAGGRGQPMTQDISLSVRGDKVVCSINGSIVASYDKTTLVGSGNLTSTNSRAGLHLAVRFYDPVHWKGDRRSQSGEAFRKE